ncbi:MAG: redoxin domain-containing protein [Deltaproteobacteria bacterium]|nr:redoxin domain-containing protein [Deltaproteobacteria bacterium]MBI4794605.1 redoxin domain-containing protein [Deltaproteobacteria bacterium]
MGLFYRIAVLILLFMRLGALPTESWGSGPTLGKRAPDFQVESGDNQTLSLDMIRGKVIVLFYESRNVIKKNIKLKNELKRLYLAQPANIQKDIFRLVVIDCSEAYWPTTPIWKSKLKEHSRKEGFTIYGDWNKRMFADYHMKREESNFLIIDKRGVIRYSAAYKVENSQFEKIKGVLSSLVQEK